MIPMKDRKQEYRNRQIKMRAAFRRRGSHINSKTFSKSMNPTMKIILRDGKNRTVFFRQFNAGGGKNAKS